jgi:hypothetical protein
MRRASPAFDPAVVQHVPPKLILCTGVVRSGSTWSFNVCRQLGMLLAGARGEPFTSTYIGELELEQLVAGYVEKLAGPTVLKAHAVGPVAVAAVRAGRVRAVCTFRDPRDCVASDLTFLGWPFDAVVRRVGENLAYLGYYRAARHALFVRYEEMIVDPLPQLARIAAHLGVDADDAELRRIDAATDLPSSRAVCAALADRPAEELVWSQTHRVDPATQLHENHIHSGRVGRWRDELTADQQEQLTAAFHPWLVELGYEPAGAGAAAYG